MKGNIRHTSLLFALLVIVATAGYSQDANRKLELLKAYPEVIVVNGKIYTIDGQMRQVQAMAVRSNRILALGTNDEIRFLAGPQTQVIDAKGRAVLPGLIDGHTHPYLWGSEHWFGAEGEATSKKYNDPQLKYTAALGNTEAEVLRSIEQGIRNRAQEMGPGKWIMMKVFGGKSIPESRRIASPLFASLGSSAPITTQFLDALAPNNPVSLIATEAIGPSQNNTKAKQEMDRIVGYEATGIIARTVIPFEILMRGRWKEQAEILKQEMLECIAEAGVTTFGDRFDRSTLITKAFNVLHQNDDMPVRFAYYVPGAGNIVSKYDKDKPEITDAIIRAFSQETGDFRGIGGDYFWNAGITNEGWEGGLTCTTATPLPNVAAQGTGRSVADGVRLDCAKAAINYDEKTGYKSVKAGLQSGLRIAFMHGYSDGTYDALFKMLSDEVTSGRMTLEEIRALRVSTEHNPIIRPNQFADFAKYNVMPAFNGYQVQGDIKGGAFLKSYGEQYMNWMAPMKSMADAGVRVVFNTDAHLGKNIPVHYKDMDYPEQWDGTIWGFMEFFATRTMPHDGITYARGEALDKERLMKSATIWGAEGAMNEKNIGSLEVGKLADFIVIDKDYFTIPADDIGSIKTILTAVGGKVMYKDANF
ncbi:MAG: hypothetical protein A3F68_13030 [Acidobacteria bacterium RIFCSPLOWO2_12_FULL_54_10]|nr:MAG: hypothetical protein A3F68_13030 [Acidobacteria bacterium RIFCSPLOWO2_12_FULL_54_10]